MNYLIDTCCISELIKKNPDPHVVQWFSDQDELSLYLSVITFGELRKGIEKLPESKRRELLTRWVNQDLKERFQQRILDISIKEVNAWGSILAKAEKVGRPVSAIDALIAATAKVHDLTVVTRNEKDLAATGVEILNPWNYSNEP